MPRVSVVRPWRLILDCAGDGAWNMAVDRALLESYETGGSPPTLRLYSWSAPTVSLGRFQKLEDVSREASVRYGVAVCCRPTGGRGVLHDDELTYAIATGTRDGLPSGIAASYRVLCSALVEAYLELGIGASLTARPRGGRAAGACYLHSTQADLSLGASKLSGSAQVWGREACLQHGSFVVSRDVEREAAVFGLTSSGAASLAESACTIQDALGRRPGEAELVEAVVEGLGRGLGVRFQPGMLTGGERLLAEQIRHRFEVIW